VAIYHLNTRIVSRSKGQSSVAAAAYRARMALIDERTGKKWDYGRRGADVLFEGIFAPKNAPEWMNDRGQLWNSVEEVEKRKDAQVARQFIIGLPHELTLDQQRFALQDFVKENFTRRGYVADVVIHKPDDQGDLRNTHAHILIPMRAANDDGFARTKERTNDPTAELERWRESWEVTGNRFLKRFGHEPTLDRRSLEAQGIDREPTIHLGQRANQMEREGIHTDRGEELHNIHQKNEARAIINDVLIAPATSAVERQRLEEQAQRIADVRDQERRSPRGLGLSHHIRDLITAVRQLSRTMGEALSHVIVGADEVTRQRPARLEPKAAPPVSPQRIEPPQRETLAQRLQRESRERGEEVHTEKAPYRRLEDELERRRRRERRIEDDIPPP
jgi:hypothetical protein